MSEQVQQEPSVSVSVNLLVVKLKLILIIFAIFLQATEKIIVSSSRLINKLENLELLKSPSTPTSSINIELLNEPRPAYEIFGNLEHLILFSDDDDDFFMPVVDGELSLR